MWLLDVQTRELVYFHREPYGRYAILSHTWGDEEILFQDLQNPEGWRKKNKKEKRNENEIDGHRKITFTCQQAAKDGLRYAWIDTCCIDKTSSAELSEAINSMFRYYARAAVCYVYLFDVELSGTSASWAESTMAQFCKAWWFKRGWTLQELVAPGKINFYDQSWKYLGSKKRDLTVMKSSADVNEGRVDLVPLLSSITKIDGDILLRTPLDLQIIQRLSVAKRMSWAAGRDTSREEDRAYCLLGLFNINMPLLYGEGENAFQRLQEEIISQSITVDHSILAWCPWESWRYEMSIGKPQATMQMDFRYPKLLSPAPYGFRDAQNIISWDVSQSEKFELTRNGLRMTARVADGSPDGQSKVMLNCRHADRPGSQIAMLLYHTPSVRTPYDTNIVDTESTPLACDRVDTSRNHGSSSQEAKWSDASLYRHVLLRKIPFEKPNAIKVHLSTATQDLKIRIAEPTQDWDQGQSILTLSLQGKIVMRMKSTTTRDDNVELLLWSRRIFGETGTCLCISVKNQSESQAEHDLFNSINGYYSGYDGQPRFRESLPAPWHNLVADKTVLIRIEDSKFLKVETRYVNFAGEIVWDLGLDSVIKG